MTHARRRALLGWATSLTIIGLGASMPTPASAGLSGYLSCISNEYKKQAYGNVQIDTIAHGKCRRWSPWG